MPSGWLRPSSDGDAAEPQTFREVPGQRASHSMKCIAMTGGGT